MIPPLARVCLDVSDTSTNTIRKTAINGASPQGVHAIFGPHSEVFKAAVRMPIPSWRNIESVDIVRIPIPVSPLVGKPRLGKRISLAWSKDLIVDLSSCFAKGSLSYCFRSLSCAILRHGTAPPSASYRATNLRDSNISINLGAMRRGWIDALASVPGVVSVNNCGQNSWQKKFERDHI
ncbi:hypothetical protein MPH_00186 [Macrophomina phaseolina MS6]|uniref:Uncharacterized protein n=1 Tax=Macrophomina phaseolina (strain MS6) TaxID=1126212 RepID=K2RIR0_MACPH|nr:hypothetical protein MPH_00186 [Macrophomina phaseolina MS6]